MPIVRIDKKVGMAVMRECPMYYVTIGRLRAPAWDYKQSKTQIVVDVRLPHEQSILFIEEGLRKLDVPEEVIEAAKLSEPKGFLVMEKP